MASIAEQLQAYRSELTQAQARGDQAIARKPEQQLREPEEFQHAIPMRRRPPRRWRCFAI
jgi:hypothetical protein